MPTTHTPLSGVLGSKEGQPVTVSATPDVIQSIEAPKMSPDVAKYIESRDAAQVPPDVAALGVTASDTQPSFANITLPISDEQIVAGLKKPINSSWRWLAESLVYRLKQMHVALRSRMGRVQRVTA